MTKIIPFITKKDPISHGQRTFKRLKAKIKQLQTMEVAIKENLDAALHLYHASFKDIKRAYYDQMILAVKLLYTHYKQVKKLTRTERRILKEIIKLRTNEICYALPLHEIDQEIEKIYNDLNDSDFEKERQQMQKILDQMDIEIDYSTLNPEDDLHEALRKMMKDYLQEKRHERESKPKSKCELAKEQRLNELENSQKDALKMIYKQLAKSFHPDLEQDTTKKVEKEQLMKQLSSAYETQDLHTLLSLEMEWQVSSGKSADELISSEKSIKLYNKILKRSFSPSYRNRYDRLNLGKADKYFPYWPALVQDEKTYNLLR